MVAVVASQDHEDALLARLRVPKKDQERLPVTGKVLRAEEHDVGLHLVEVVHRLDRVVVLDDLRSARHEVAAKPAETSSPQTEHILTLSKRTEYGVRAVIQLARMGAGQYVQSKDLASQEELPTNIALQLIPLGDEE